MNHTITKTQCELYKIRSNKSHGTWADITLDYTGTNGRIQIASDYGDWQYYFGSTGQSFKQFLCTLDKCYVARKFKADNRFDFKNTINEVIEYVLSLRKSEDISCDTARDAYNKAIEMKSVGDMLKDIYFSEIYNSCEFNDIYPDLEAPFHTSYDNGFLSFWNELWPVFTNALKEEEVK